MIKKFIPIENADYDLKTLNEIIFNFSKKLNEIIDVLNKFESIIPKSTNEIIIENIKSWQRNPKVHPLTCGYDSRHPKLEAIELDGKVKLVCPSCTYIQNNIPEMFKDFRGFKNVAI
jgi:hypothetical protein